MISFSDIMEMASTATQIIDNMFWYGIDRCQFSVKLIFLLDAILIWMYV